jgi:hypothetical protein
MKGIWPTAGEPGSARRAPFMWAFLWLVVAALFVWTAALALSG